MTSKNKTDKATVQPPNQPPKELQQDYASLPQKPIKLKKDLNHPPARKGGPSGKKAQTKKEPIPVPRRKATAKKKANTNKSTQWTLKGISPESKALAINAAEQVNMKVSEWLEKVIHQATQPSPENTTPIDTEMLTSTLKSIQQRLDRIEQQKGFWGRFWDQFMEQSKKKD
ncbi:MAG: hypothetical protein KZQ80_06090 [Candidatus Thiodiazotropha sp. (ex Monitilora ramsayi)]|nr:hypothetical protein [Candidatus Thiodiazotropha sp. (ex Monitilora ramsayi)]